MARSRASRDCRRRVLLAVPAACVVLLCSRIATAQIGPGLVTSVQYGAGWNMVGLANTPFNASVRALFPDAASALFRFTDHYTVDSILRPGAGYWIKLDEPRIAQHAGVWLTLPRTIAVESGWNLISTGASEPAPVASIVVTGTTLQSSFFGFNDGYYVVTTIEPGHAYWVKAETHGTITFRR